jgi:hypothetical protein
MAIWIHFLLERHQFFLLDLTKMDLGYGEVTLQVTVVQEVLVILNVAVLIIVSILQIKQIYPLVLRTTGLKTSYPFLQ